MATKVKLPCLNSNGYTDDSLIVFDMLMSHFFESRFSQSYLYSGSVASFQYIIAKNQNDMTATCSEIAETLKKYLGVYFDTVNVECFELDAALGSAAAKISLFLEVTDKDGIVLNLSTISQKNITVFKDIIQVINTGARA